MSPLLYPYTWHVGDKQPGLILIFHDLQLISDNLIIKAQLQRPANTIEKTLLILDEQRASLIWEDLDLVQGINQLLTFYSVDALDNRNTLGQIRIDVNSEDC